MAWLMLQGGPWRVKAPAGAPETVLVRILPQRPAPVVEPSGRVGPAPRAARQRAPRVAAPAGTANAAGEAPAVEETTAGPGTDGLKAAIRAAYLAAEPSARRTTSISLSLSDKLGQEIQKAARPNCNDPNYVPKIGLVGFTGLLKLPFLAAGAVSDKTCKW
jgi:hypothetical protein